MLLYGEHTKKDLQQILRVSLTTRFLNQVDVYSETTLESHSYKLMIVDSNKMGAYHCPLCGHQKNGHRFRKFSNAKHKALAAAASAAECVWGEEYQNKPSQKKTYTGKP